MKNNVAIFVISAVAIALALAYMFGSSLKIDSTVLWLFVIAAVPWLFPFLKSLTLPGGAVVEFREKLAEVERKVDVIEGSGQLPGRSEPVQPEARQVSIQGVLPEDAWYTDPNHGKFGGSPVANGRELTAQIEPAAGDNSAACYVTLTVRSLDPARPLLGVVRFHLHPTFGSRKEYDVPVVGGVATDRFTSWGVFTAGAVADEGNTRLELDLKTVPGGTPKFYAQ